MAITLVDIFEARRRIGHLIRKTPLVPCSWLSPKNHSDGRVFLKLESLQTTGAFKLRGALNAMLAHRERCSIDRGEARTVPMIVTASAGNHGLAMAWAAQLAGLPLTVFAPRDAPRTKLDAIARHGATLVADASGYDEAEGRAKTFAAANGLSYISAYSHPDVIAGAGTIGLELFEDLPGLERIVVPLGGGGLISGIAIAARAIAPSVEVVGVEAAASTAFHTSLAAGRISTITPHPTLADGLAGNMDPETITFELIQKLVSRVCLVDEPAIAAAISALAREEHLIVEGAGAVGVAALTGDLLAGGTTAVIVSGGNIDLARFASVINR